MIIARAATMPRNVTVFPPFDFASDSLGFAAEVSATRTVWGILTEALSVCGYADERENARAKITRAFIADSPYETPER